MDLCKKWSDLQEQKHFQRLYPENHVINFVQRNWTTENHKKILDLGCGTGRHSLFLAKEGFDVYGIDFSESGIAHSRSLAKEIPTSCKGSATFVLSSIEQLPYANNYFDGCLSISVLCCCYTESYKKSIDEIFRVLKPCAKAYIVVRALETYSIVGAQSNGNGNYIDKRGLHVHIFCKEELRELFKKFSVIEINTFTRTFDNEKFKDHHFLITLEK